MLILNLQQYTDLTIDLALPNNFNQKMLTDTPSCGALTYEDILNTQIIENDETVIQALSAETRGVDLIISFSHLLKIAQYTDEYDAHKVRLIAFCKACLRAARHVPLSEQDTPVPYFANVLYRVAMHPNCFEGIDSCSWQECVTITRSLSVPDIKMLQAKDVYAGTLVSAQDMVENLKRTMSGSIPILVSRQPIVRQIQPEWKQEYVDIPCDKEGDEQTVGRAMYECMQNKRQFAEKALTADELKRLHHAVVTYQDQLIPILEKKWAEIEPLAHKMPSDTRLEQVYHMQETARTWHFPSRQDLFKLYLHQDRLDYYTMTALREEHEIIELHTLLHEYITFAVQAQQMQRILDAFKQNDVLEIAELVTQDMPDGVQGDPCLMLFQYLNNKMLRPIQAQALTRSLQLDPEGHYRDLIEKMVMGAGKTSVMVPLLAQKKANGKNLVIVELLPDLLNAQHPDMSELSYDLFQQTGHRFEFNRDSDHSWQRLKQIYEQFQRIAIKKDYLVTTGVSMLALYLKYPELLISRPEKQQDQLEWHQQLIWAEKISDFLEDSGDAILEEVHITLWQKRKINYVFGDAGPIDANLIQYSIQLYELIAQHPECREGGAVLIDYLLNASDSPLYETIPSHLKEIVKSYCMNQCHAIPQEILDLDDNTKDMLAFYKEQSLLLPKTLLSKYKEKYGPSKEIKKNAAEKRVAIPYSAKDKPEERSCFAHELQTINYTIQGVLKDGLDEQLLCEAIQLWQTKARQSMTPSQTLDETTLAEEINGLLSCANLTLQTIDLTRAVDKAALANFYHDPAMILRVLQDHILPQIKEEASVLHADACDHVDLYLYLLGLSGTPWNESTYKRLRRERHVALGNDGYVQAMIEKKVVRVQALPFDGLESFIQAMQLKSNTQALIDVCARFVGIESIQVAIALAQYFSAQSSPIKYVLYFNEEGLLYALPVTPNAQPIEFKTCNMAKICRSLDCTLEELFTYYDQPRALGMNLIQAPTAHAIVLFDEQTQYQSCLQGCSRMRSMDKQHTLDWVVTPSLENKSIEELFDLMQRNQDMQLMEDNVPATIDKLESIIRKDLRKRIKAIDKQNTLTKHHYMLAFEPFFFDRVKKNSIFEKYGQIYRNENTEAVFNLKREALLQGWAECLNMAQIPVIEQEQVALDQAMQAVIAEAKDNCPKNTLYRPGVQRLDQEAQRQHELELEEELEKLSEFYDPNLKEVQQTPWNLTRARPLNHWCGQHAPFSNCLLYSTNYAQVYIDQSMTLDHYVKPVCIIYFFIDSSSGLLKACLITQKEAREIQKANGPGTWWLSTSQHTEIAERRPESMLQSESYKSLIEQICYFNGELHHLISRRAPCRWLNEKALHYYEQHIMPNREAIPISEENKHILKNSTQSSSSVAAENSADAAENWSARSFRGLKTNSTA